MIENNQKINDLDNNIFHIMNMEKNRQEQHIELIASENYTSSLIMHAQGSCLTNKYAEGYPNKRYYGGCENVDIIEQIAIDRAKALFGAAYANVQPHSGSQANAAAFMALTKPGDTILGMNLSNGGHLTHGAKPNFSGKYYNAIQYGISNNTGNINYKQIEYMAIKYKPKMIIAGFSAYSRIIDWIKFRKIANKINAYLFVDIAHVAGLIAAGIYPTPIPYADIVTSTTHKTLRGPRGGLILARNNKTIHKKINSAIFPGTQGGPLMHIIAAKAICFKEAASKKFINYQKQVVNNTKSMVEIFIKNNFDIVSKGTDNHLFLLNLIKDNITGKDAEKILNKANITVNKNSIPKDPKSPFITSGLRIGTSAITTRGFQEKESRLIAEWICKIIRNPKNKKIIFNIKNNVLKLCNQFPVYK